MGDIPTILFCLSWFDRLAYGFGSVVMQAKPAKKYLDGGKANRPTTLNYCFFIASAELGDVSKNILQVMVRQIQCDNKSISFDSVRLATLSLLADRQASKQALH